MKKIVTAMTLLVLAAGAVAAFLQFKATAPESAPTNAFKGSSANADGSKAAAPKTIAQQQSEAAAGSIEIAASDLATARMREVRRELPLTGQLRPVQVALLRAKVAGEVMQMLVKEGDSVTRGQVLARLDAAEHQARLDERMATLAASKATWENHERIRNNNEELLRKGFISQSAYDTTLANSSVAQAQVKAALANVALARRALDDTIVKAPWTGLIAERAVQSGDKASVDTRLLTLVDLSRMEVEAGVPASEIPSVAAGQEVAFTVEGFGVRAFKGVIARINPQSVAGSRSIMVYIEVPNADAALKGGMFAKGSLALSRRESVLAVPLTALREERGETVVYAVLETGKGSAIARIAVKPGVRNEEDAWVEISAPDGAGLKPGVPVVKANLGALIAGAQVRVVEIRAGAAAAPAALVTPAAPVTPAVPAAPAVSATAPAAAAIAPK